MELTSPIWALARVTTTVVVAGARAREALLRGTQRQTPPSELRYYWSSERQRFEALVPWRLAKGYRVLRYRCAFDAMDPNPEADLPAEERVGVIPGSPFVRLRRVDPPTAEEITLSRHSPVEMRPDRQADALLPPRFVRKSAAPLEPSTEPVRRREDLIVSPTVRDRVSPPVASIPFTARRSGDRVLTRA